MLITFSGLDGAGKSTLIEWLKTTLEKQNRSVAVFHMTDHVGVYAYARALRDGLQKVTRLVLHAGNGEQQRAPGAISAGGQAAAPSGLSGLTKTVRRVVLWNKPIRRLLYPVDLLVFLFYRLYIEKLKKQVLIMDRYFYDTLVDVSSGRGWFWIRLLERLTPTPGVPILLDVDPEEAYGRKREYSVEYLRRRWSGYKKVFTWIRSSVTLANHDLGATKEALQKVVMQRIAAQ